MDSNVPYNSIINFHDQGLTITVHDYIVKKSFEGEHNALGHLNRILPSLNFRVGIGGFNKTLFATMLDSSGMKIVHPPMVMIRVHTINFISARDEPYKNARFTSHDDIYAIVNVELGKGEWKTYKFAVIINDNRPNCRLKNNSEPHFNLLEIDTYFI